MNLRKMRLEAWIFLLTISYRGSGIVQWFIIRIIFIIINITIMIVVLTINNITIMFMITYDHLQAEHFWLVHCPKG